MTYRAGKGRTGKGKGEAKGARADARADLSGARGSDVRNADVGDASADDDKAHDPADRDETDGDLDKDLGGTGGANADEDKADGRPTKKTRVFRVQSVPDQTATSSSSSSWAPHLWGSSTSVFPQWLPDREGRVMYNLRGNVEPDAADPNTWPIYDYGN